MQIKVYEIESNRWGYTVGGVTQEWNPESPGFVPMSQADASTFAQATADRLQQQDQGTHRSVSNLSFFGRFTDAELSLIYTLAKQNVDVEIWLERFKITGGDIYLDDPRTVLGMKQLEAAGILAEGRAAEVLT